MSKVKKIKIDAEKLGSTPFILTAKEGLYIIQASNEINSPIKLGYSNNLNNRLQDYYSHNPNTKVLHLFTGLNTYEIEQEFHKTNKSVFKKEWYDFEQYQNMIDFLVDKKLKEISIEQESIFNNESYTKIYTRASLRLHIMALPEKAKSLYLWLVYELDNNVDYVWINRDRYMKECTVSINTAKAAIQDLCTTGIITPTIFAEHYWINPLFFFNGNRITKYPNNIQLR